MDGVEGLGGRRGGDCHFDWFALFAVFDRGAEGVFEELGEDVFEVGGHVGEAGVGLAVDGDGGADAVFELADLRDEGLAVPDYFGGPERCVYHADGGRGPLLGVGVVAVAVRLRGQVQRDVLFGDQPRPDPGPQVLVQKPRHVPRTDVFPTLEEPPRQDRYGVRVRLHEVGHDLCELDFLVQRVDLPLLVGEQGGERVDVVVVDAGYVRVRDDDEGKVAQGLDPVGEPDGEEGEGEVCGGEERGCGQRGSAMSGECVSAVVGQSMKVRGEMNRYRTRSANVKG